ncbi:MAG TPA: YciI family protein [Cellulomonas sp.]|nr:YciI family protein [Cellulomonas sp.]
MAKFVLTVVEPAGPPPADLDLARIMKDVDALDQELRTASLWVFAGGLEPPAGARTVRHEGDELVVVDGPFADGPEHVGGFTVVDVHDEAEALGWAKRFAAATGLPIEVRAFRS